MLSANNGRFEILDIIECRIEDVKARHGLTRVKVTITDPP